ncbi:MAG: GNAT family N-acetyltransferase [Acetobacteraceae bacterium]|nr:GNAT family N-acetyltransferase [Acetobacteraceae bacterium]
MRPGRDADADGFIALISACWSEYPAIVFDVDAELPEFRWLASYYAAKGGRVWAAEVCGRIVGMIAAAPSGSAAFEIGRLYVYPQWRGTGLAYRLLDRAEEYARAAGAYRLALWSDTRFERAHRFYEKCSYVRSGPVRALNDLSNTLEYGYAKPLSALGVERLDGAAAGSAVRALGELCQVSAGAAASVSDPRDLFRRIASEVAERRRILLGGWCEGVLRGAVTLTLDTPPDQPHRALVEWLLVDPVARRRGLARLLMGALEDEAHRAGRSLLTASARADRAVMALSRSLGWIQAGRIPDARMDPDRSLHDELIFCKRLAPSPPRPS